MYQQNILMDIVSLRDRPHLIRATNCQHELLNPVVTVTASVLCLLPTGPT